MKFLGKYAFFGILNTSLSAIRDFYRKKEGMGYQGFEA
jgi:hypothetical protein